MKKLVLALSFVFVLGLVAVNAQDKKKEVKKAPAKTEAAAPAAKASAAPAKAAAAPAADAKKKPAVKAKKADAAKKVAPATDKK